MLSEQELWQNALVHIEMSVSATNFKTWFKDTSIIKNVGGEVYIGAPNKIVKEWLQDKHSTFILKVLRGFDDSIRSVHFQINKSPAKKRKSTIQETVCEATTEKLPMQNYFVDKKDNLNPKYTFDTFVVGPFNQLAHAAAQTVAKNQSLTYNPLFIYGNTGYGKTHLTQAVGNYIKKTNPNIKVFYVSSEKFSMDYINAVRSGKAHTFKDKYRQYDVLIMDDIQFIAEKEKTQEELFHLFNALYENNKQIIFSSDKHPNFMPGLEDRLRSRFSAGMIAEITAPEIESREMILKEKAESKNMVIPERIIKYIAKEIEGNIRELEGILNTVVCQLQLKNELTDDDLRRLIKNNTRLNKNIPPEEVIKRVARFYNIDEDSIYKKTRKKEVVKPRQIIMYILREDFDISFPTIGEKLGGRDHTTVIHSCEKIKKMMNDDPILKDEIDEVRSILSG